MGYVLGLSAFISVVTFLLVAYHFARGVIAGTAKKRDMPLVLIGIAQAVFAVVLFVWAVDHFDFLVKDFVIIFSVVMIFQTAALLLVMYNATKEKKVFYTLPLYVLLVPFVLLEPAHVHMIIPVSFVAILLSFTLFSNLHRRINQTPIVFAIVSLMGYIVASLWQSLIPLAILVSNVLFLLFIHFFMKRLRSHPEMTVLERSKETPIHVEFVKHFLFLIILTNFVFIGTIGVHEVGHIGSAKLFNCQDAKIVVEFDAMPHTETTCSNDVSVSKLILGGVLFPFLIALLLLLGGGKFVGEIALQIAGFNLIISHRDLVLLGLSAPISLSVQILGVVVAILALGLLAKSKTF